MYIQNSRRTSPVRGHPEENYGNSRDAYGNIRRTIVTERSSYAEAD